MTIEQLLAAIGAHPWLVLGYLALPPLASWLLGMVKYPRSGTKHLWDYVYSVLIYLATIPGVFSATLLGYSLFFIRQNLLNVNLLLYVGPVISMITTLVLCQRKVAMSRLPGFDRLSGLVLILALTFVVLLVLYKTRIIVGFFGSLESLIVLGIVMFLAFEYAAKKLFK